MASTCCRTCCHCIGIQPSKPTLGSRVRTWTYSWYVWTPAPTCLLLNPTSQVFILFFGNLNFNFSIRNWFFEIQTSQLGIQCSNIVKSAAQKAKPSGDWARCIGHLSAGVKGFPAADLRNAQKKTWFRGWKQENIMKPSSHWLLIHIHIHIHNIYIYNHNTKYY